MAPQSICVMKDLHKVVPPSRKTLRVIWLSLYRGVVTSLSLTSEGAIAAR